MEDEQYRFFGLFDRLKYIARWSLMRNARPENVAEHSFLTAVLAGSLCMIANTLYAQNLNSDRAAALALFHETAEVLTGDLPTPIKYKNDDIRSAYRQIEQAAETRMLCALPPELRDTFSVYVQPDKTQPEYAYVKYADKLGAYVKCLQEIAFGNTEFVQAEQSILKELHAFNDPSVEYFLMHFTKAFSQSLDELF